MGQKIMTSENATGAVSGEALKPCPFCGNPAKLRISVVGSFFTIMCSASLDVCGVAPCTCTYQDKGRAVDEWNRRTQSERSEFAEIVERLKQRGVIPMEFDAGKLEVANG
jgi:hypothetical protein